VLSGLGGDEIFWGYRHVRFAGALAGTCRFMSALPMSARRRLARLAAAGASRLRPGLDRAAYLETPTTASAYLLVRGLFTPAQVRGLLGLSPEELGTAPFAPPQKIPGGIDRKSTRLNSSHGWSSYAVFC